MTPSQQKEKAAAEANTSWRIGKAAFAGRLAGTFGKILLGTAIVLVAIVAMLV
jgi:hypothetical protein